jgi:hypothetical protein
MRESFPSIIGELDPTFSLDVEALPTFYRDQMPTLKDWNPLRHDPIHACDTRPTLPDIDPLRHDLPS